MNKILKVIIFGLIFTLLFSACTLNSSDMQRYSAQYLVYFDTYSTFECYAKSQEEFDRYSDIAEEELKKYHQYFDIYNDYPQINNIKTINDNAGIKAVEVDEEILNLIDECINFYKQTDGRFNIALGSVLKLWHIERTAAIENPENAKLPDMNELKKAAEHISIDNIIIDKENLQVFIADREASIDLGGIAKGYAAEKTVERLKKEGVTSGILNLGGNVYAIGKPYNKDKWTIGVQSTDENNNTIVADKVYVNDISVVSSGDYQRYYTVDGKNYHHIIDSATLMPAEEFKAVTVIHKDSKTADMLSTSLFIMPFEDGKSLAESYGAEAVWYYTNGLIEKTDGYAEYEE